MKKKNIFSPFKKMLSFFNLAFQTMNKMDQLFIQAYIHVTTGLSTERFLMAFL